MLKTLLSMLAIGLLWASGCAGVAEPPAGGQSATPVRPPAIDDDTDPVYLMLVGEIAGQRGQFDVALEHYSRLAKNVPDVRLAERATQIALYVQDADKALETAKLWTSLDPKSIPAHRLSAVLEIKAGNIDKAVDAVGELLTLKDPELEATLLELVKWLATQVPPQKALEVMQALSEHYPKVPEIRFASALLASDLGALPVARTELAQAEALRPGWSRPLMLEAQLEMQAGEMHLARQALERAKKADPKNPRLALLFGQFLAKTGDFKSAEREFSMLVALDPKNQEARFALASVWLELGQYLRARSAFEALAMEPRWQAQSDFSMGLIDARLGQPENALKAFDRVGPGPWEFDARFNGISALVSLKRYDEARDRLQKVRKAFPDEKHRLYLIESDLLVKQHDYQEAYTLLNDALTEDPGRSELLYARALLADQLGKTDVMEADLRAVLAKNPEDASALNALGFALADHGKDRLDEAEGYIRKALQKKPRDPAILDSFGWVQFRKGRLDQAISYLRKAFALFPDAEIAAHLGEALWAGGKREEARRIWRDAWEKSPDQDDMRRIHDQYPAAFEGSPP